MSRLHVHIAVEDLERNIHFYSALFGTDPSLVKDNYAKWDLADPAVSSKQGRIKLNKNKIIAVS